jgi:hypothetical protein
MRWIWDDKCSVTRRYVSLCGIDKSRERPTQTTCDLIRLARDKEIDAIMLAAELLVEPILEVPEGGVLVPGDSDGCRLVFGRVHLDVVL